jgi:hypothetical protein
VDADRAAEEVRHQNCAEHSGLRNGEQDRADDDKDSQGSRSAVGEARGPKLRISAKDRSHRLAVIADRAVDIGVRGLWPATNAKVIGR